MYNNLWLNYEKLDFTGKRGEFLRDCLLNVQTRDVDIHDSIVASAVSELSLFAEIATGGTSGKGSDINKSKETKNGPHTELVLIPSKNLPVGSYEIVSDDNGISVSAGSPEGLLYGTFRLIALIRSGGLSGDVSISEIPDNPLRMLNHWDNFDGSIERGYSGDSFYFEGNRLVVNDRTKVFARAVASVGINGVVINNVNVKGEASFLISDSHYREVRKLSELFASYGIRLFLSVNFALPMEYGLNCADPCDEIVSAWWKDKCAEIYRNVPLFGGFLIKADSEGRPGPFTYGRNQADGANMLAEAIKPYDGLIIWRCFVYNCKQDWRDLKTDRARAGYDYFHDLDGKFADNVILQIKNGPMDFQVREPVSPLFGGMEHTNEMLEVQIAQEYTGQQKHVCYLIPWFKEILSFNTYLNGNATVADIVSTRALSNPYGGMTAVCNTGNDFNWTGHDLAGANLYGFGRLSFTTNLSAEEIALEWIKLYLAQSASDTYYIDGPGKRITDTVLSILMRSWPVYEKYTSPLGIGWMVTPHYHYGPDVDGYEYSPWGTYHKADCHAIGVERSESGTGFTTQYRQPNSDLYGNVETCPDNLLLFFHRAEYTHVLRSGKTIIQHIYDTHFEGEEEVRKMSDAWDGLHGIIEDGVFNRVHERFEMQKASAREWRDVINSYFYRKTGIADEHGRELY